MMREFYQKSVLAVNGYCHFSDTNFKKSVEAFLARG